MPGFTFKRFVDAAEFREAAEPWLLQDEAAHCLQLGLIGGLAVGEWQVGPFLAVVSSVTGPALVAIRTPPHALVLSACSDAGALDVLLDAVMALPPEEQPDGVLGPADVAAEFVKRWPGPGTPTLQMRERIYRLDQVRAVTGVAGRPVRAAERDRPRLTEWFSMFHAEALPGEPFDAEETVGRWLASPERRQLWFWEVDGEPVSLAGAGNATLNGIRLGPVFTPQEHRGRGYASALTADLSQRLLDSGRSFTTLFTDLANPTSNSIYTRIGYRPVVDVNQYRLQGARN